jgi:hypothetical protein
MIILMTCYSIKSLQLKKKQQNMELKSVNIIEFRAIVVVYL